LLGNPRTIGEAFHITSDDVLTWNQITMILAAAAGVEAKIIHVPSHTIAAADPNWGPALLGDSAHSMIFDNSKLRSVVPDYVATITLEQAAPEIIEWHDGDQSRQRLDTDLDALMDKLSAEFRVRG
jgi:nucleoside-diphosphate-sugar epimerase